MEFKNNTFHSTPMREGADCLKTIKKRLEVLQDVCNERDSELRKAKDAKDKREAETKKLANELVRNIIQKNPPTSADTVQENYNKCNAQYKELQSVIDYHIHSMEDSYTKALQSVENASSIENEISSLYNKMVSLYERLNQVRKSGEYDEVQYDGSELMIKNLSVIGQSVIDNFNRAKARLEASQKINRVKELMGEYGFSEEDL